MSKKYPKVIRAVDVAGGYFAPDLFKFPGGRVTYDQVWINDGGNALYLVRVNPDLSVTRRWIPWEAEIVQMFEFDDNF